MTVHLQKELAKLKELTFSMYQLVIEQVHLSFQAFIHKDLELAKKVIAGDDRINQLEVQIEDECLKTIALNQPVAQDLRFLIAVLKMNNELERIGDLAVNIADVLPIIARAKKPVQPPAQLLGILDRVKVMISDSLQALMNLDPARARRVLESDNEVDNLHRSMYPEVARLIREDLEDVESLIPLLAISRSLERMADHATNIAEDVIYLIEGRIVRHGYGGKR
jgi:phosphate transport system protein